MSQTRRVPLSLAWRIAAAWAIGAVPLAALSRIWWDASGGAGFLAMLVAWVALIGGVARLTFQVDDLKQRRAPVEDGQPYRPGLSLTAGTLQALPVGFGFAALGSWAAEPGVTGAAMRLGLLVVGGAAGSYAGCLGARSLRTGSAADARPPLATSIRSALPTALVAGIFGVTVTAAQVDVGLIDDPSWWPRHLALVALGSGGGMGLLVAVKTRRELEFGFIDCPAPRRSLGSPAVVGAVIALLVWGTGSWIWPGSLEVSSPTTRLAVRAAWGFSIALLGGTLGAWKMLKRMEPSA